MPIRGGQTNGAGITVNGVFQSTEYKNLFRDEACKGFWPQVKVRINTRSCSPQAGLCGDPEFCIMCVESVVGAEICAWQIDGQIIPDPEDYPALWEDPCLTNECGNSSKVHTVCALHHLWNTTSTGITFSGIRTACPMYHCAITANELLFLKLEWECPSYDLYFCIVPYDLMLPCWIMYLTITIWKVPTCPPN